MVRSIPFQELVDENILGPRDHRLRENVCVSFCYAYQQESYQLSGTLKPFSERRWCKKLENKENEHLFLRSLPQRKAVQDVFLIDFY